MVNAVSPLNTIDDVPVVPPDSETAFHMAPPSSAAVLPLNVVVPLMVMSEFWFAPSKARATIAPPYADDLFERNAFVDASVPITSVAVPT